MLSVLLGTVRLTFWMEWSAVIFLAVFSFLCWLTYRPGNAVLYKRLENLPFEETDDE